MTEEKPLLCPFCMWQTKIIEDLEDHLREHDHLVVSVALADYIIKERETIPKAESEIITVEDMRRWVKKYVEHYFIPKAAVRDRIKELENTGPRWEGDDSNDVVIEELEDLLGDAK